MNCSRLPTHSWLLALVLISLAGCGGQSAPPEEQQAAPSESANVFPVVTETDAVVSGFVKGTMVRMQNAEFDGQLAIFEGDGWGWNPSLLIFLFLGDEGVPEGRTFNVSSEGGINGSTPHVHYRWRTGDGDSVDANVVSDGYEMTLVFGKAENGVLPGTIEFKVPGEDTDVSGSFRATLE